jgi:hypothetical protein
MPFGLPAFEILNRCDAMISRTIESFFRRTGGSGLPRGMASQCFSVLKTLTFG